MNTELIKTVESTRAKLKEASVLLRKVAAGEVAHTAEVEAGNIVAPIDADKLRDVFEDMAAAHLVKTAEIEPAVESATKDPNVLLDTIRMLALRVASVQDAKPAAEAPRSPGRLVNRTASAFGKKEGAVDKMRRACEEAARRLP